MNTKKIKPSLAKKLTAAVMSAAMVFSVAGGASVALRDSGSLQNVKADDDILYDSDISFYSDAARASITSGTYYDAGTFTLQNGMATNFSTSVKGDLSVAGSVGNTAANVSFYDPDMPQKDGKYTYVAVGSANASTKTVSWSIQAWPYGQNNVEQPFVNPVNSSEWDDLWTQANPVWETYKWDNPTPWLSMTTIGFTSNTYNAADTGVEVDYYGSTWYGPNNMNELTSLGKWNEVNAVTYRVNEYSKFRSYDVPLYADSSSGRDSFSGIFAILNPNAATADKAVYPAYQIPAFIDYVWTDIEIPAITSYNGFNLNGPMTAVRLDDMHANVSVDPAAVSVVTSDFTYNYKDAAGADQTKTFNAEYPNADAFNVALAMGGSSFSGFGSRETGVHNNVKVMRNADLAFTSDSSVATKFTNFNADIANSRMGLKITVSPDYSVSDDYSRVTANIDGSFDGTPVDPDNPDEPDITAAEIKSTTATAANGIAKTIPCATDAVIRDRIVYDGLVDGKTYTVTTSVVDKATGNLLVDSQSSVFVASASKYTDVTINLDTSKYAGKQLVVFETISLNGYEQASHKDLNDADQTVTVASQIVSSEPYIYRTVATNGSSNTSNNNYNYNYWNSNWGWTYDKTIPCGANAIINDRVYYEDFIDGETYTITATLYDARTGYALSEVKSPIVQFVANSRVGYVDVKIPFNSTNYAGRSIVVFETVTKYDKDLRREAEVCSHRDLTDPDQTVYVESQLTNQYTCSITKTEATGVSTRNHTLAYSTAAQIRDTVSYKDFVVGNTYTVYTSVYDKSTNAAVVNNKVTTHRIDSTSGSFDVIIDLDSTKYAGKSLVVFETVYLNGVGICYHRDINDANQTVTVANKPDGTVITPNPIDPDPINPTPSNPTEVIGIASNKSIAIDSVNKTHTMSYSVNAEILNRVTYTGLENGSLYTVTSTIVDKATGSAVLNPVSKSFTADSSRGYVEVNIPIDTTQYPNRQLVAYAVISRDGHEVSSYKNLNDANATVTIATTSTVLTADNMTSKSVPVSQSVTLVDLVRYEGLTPGQTYKITGHVLHKESANGKDFSTADAVFDGVEGSLVTNGAKVVATQTYEFTPSQASGTATVKFNVNTVGLSGQHLVAVEIIADKDSNAIVCEHKDINDANQTVVVKTSSNVYTGGNDMTIFFIVGSIICVLAAGGVGAFLFIKKRRTNS